VNDQPVLTKKFESVSGVEAPELRLEEVKLQRHQPRPDHDHGRRSALLLARAEYFSTDEKLERTGTVALNLLRDYYRLAPTKVGERLCMIWRR